MYIVLVIIPSQKATLRLYTVYTILRHLHICIINLLQAADIFSYTSAISACATGGQWQQALNFFARMTLAKIQPQPGGKLGESLRSVVPLFTIAFSWCTYITSISLWFMVDVSILFYTYMVCKPTNITAVVPPCKLMTSWDLSNGRLFGGKIYAVCGARPFWSLIA